MRMAAVLVLLCIGLIFSASGVVGIVRMPDLYTRVQCSSKTVTMGALPVLVAVAVAKGPISPFGARALLIAFLLLVVNPLSSHALVRAAYKSGVPMWKGAAIDQVAASDGRRPSTSAGRQRRPSSPKSDRRR